MKVTAEIEVELYFRPASVYKHRMSINGAFMEYVSDAFLEKAGLQVGKFDEDDIILYEDVAYQVTSALPGKYELKDLVFGVHTMETASDVDRTAKMVGRCA